MARMSQQKTTRPRNTVVAGNKREDSDIDADLDDDAESDPKYDRAQTDKTMTAPRGQRYAQSNRSGAVADHLMHRPIKRGSLHRR